MGNPVINEFILELKSFELVNNDCDKTELYSIICEKSDKRWEILQCLMSKFSKYYAEQLQNTSDIKLELIRILSDLHFTNSSNKTTFVSGDCSVEEQKKIFNEIFKVLKFVTIGNSSESINTSEEFDFPEKEQLDMQLKKIPLSNLNKEFNLNKAMKTLEETGKLLDNFAVINAEELSQTKSVQQELIAVSGTKAGEACNSYKQCIDSLESRLLQHPMECLHSSDELASKVGRLHCALRTITASLQTSS